jgi:hypothetical protein
LFISRLAGERRARRNGSRRLLAAAVVLLLGGSAALAAVIEGQIFDRDGRPLAGLTVQVIERTGGGPIPGLAAPEKVQEIGRAESDPRGFFRVELGSRTLNGQILVRCHDPEKWDRVRYAPPLDRDATRALAGRGRAVVTCLVEDAAGWAELAREIERSGGPESDRGRILRRMGAPPETVVQKAGQVEWRYPEVVYVFRDGVLVDTRRAGERPRANPAEASRRLGEGR